MTRIKQLCFYVATPTRGYFATLPCSGAGPGVVHLLGGAKGLPLNIDPSTVLFITGDPAVTDFHAVLEYGAEGKWYSLRGPHSGVIVESAPGGGPARGPGSKFKVGGSTVWFLEAVMEGAAPTRYNEVFQFIETKTAPGTVFSVSLGPRDTTIPIGGEALPGKPSIILPHPSIRRRHTIMERQGQWGELRAINLGANSEALNSQGSWEVFNAVAVNIGTALRFGGQFQLELVERYPKQSEEKAAPTEPSPAPPPTAPTTPKDLSFKASLIRAGRRGIARAVRWARDIEKAER